jgi:hypothetical protein
MNKRHAFVRAILLAVATAGALALLSGCASTPKIDWASRVGVYSYDQAVIDYGPPDKAMKLSDNSTVAEWLTRKGYYHHSYVGIAGYYGPYYPYYPYRYWGPYFYGPPIGYYDPVYFPDRFLRLVFGADGKLRDWRTISK